MFYRAFIGLSLAFLIVLLLLLLELQQMLQLLLLPIAVAFSLFFVFFFWFQLCCTQSTHFQREMQFLRQRNFNCVGAARGATVREEYVLDSAEDRSPVRENKGLF